MRIPRPKLLALTIILGAFVLYAFLTKVGPRKLLFAISRTNPAYMLMAVSVFIASYAFGALGLWHLLGKKVNRWFLLKAHVVGYFLNNITPVAGYGGEFVKAEIIARRTDEPRARVFAAVIIQKILHFAPFLSALIISAVFLASKSALGEAAFIAGMASAVAGLFIAVIAIFVSRRAGPAHLVCSVLEAGLGMLEKIERRFLPSSIFADAKKSVREFHGIAHLMFWKKSVAAPAAFTFLMLASEIIAFLLVLVSLGLHMTLPAVVLSYTIAVFVGMLPITPGGLGTYDATLAWMLFLFGAPESKAIAASLLFRLIQYWMTNALGIIALARISK